MTRFLDFLVCILFDHDEALVYHRTPNNEIRVGVICLQCKKELRR